MDFSGAWLVSNRWSLGYTVVDYIVSTVLLCVCFGWHSMPSEGFSTQSLGLWVSFGELCDLGGLGSHLRL